MPRLVRQAPLTERLQAYLDPWDWLLWIAEELNDDAYDDWLKLWAAPIGVFLNIAFILARGASSGGPSQGYNDDVFGDTRADGSAWLSWLAVLVVYFLTVACCLNALYTFFRRRHYRLFEQPVDIAPETPSARRVRVDSSPVSSSPLRYLQNVISATTASSRAYPDAEKEVWELSVWDPKPFNLSIFTYFSPGHVLLYYTFLPPVKLDPRPSVTVFTAIAFGVLLSLQLSLLRSSFSQQTKDTSLIHGEVINEYDTKYVRPSLNRPVRDVATQTRESSVTPRGTKTREVDVYTPTTIVNRGFRTNPNPNYAGLYDPDNLAAQPSFSPANYQSSMNGQLNRSTTMPNLNTPRQNGSTQTTDSQSLSSRATTSRNSTAADFSSPLKPHHERLRERTPFKGDGGSLGVYSHAASPLRKAVSSNYLTAQNETPGNMSNGFKGTSSPLKRSSYAPGTAGGSGSDALMRDRSAGFGVGTGANAARRRETGRF